MKLSTIEKIQKRVSRIASGKDLRVKPGQVERFSEAVADGDLLRQGDLYLIAAERGGQFAWNDFLKSNGYTRSKKPSTQLVPGNTIGAKHCLDSTDGVEMWLPESWNDESLRGPFIRFKQERKILHPTHGAVIVPAGMSVLCWYQREHDRELQKERRARD